MPRQRQDDRGPATDLETTAEFRVFDVAGYEARQAAAAPVAHAAENAAAASDTSPLPGALQPPPLEALRDMEEWTASPEAGRRAAARTTEFGRARARLPATLQRLIAFEAELDSARSLLSRVERAQADHDRERAELSRALSDHAHQLARLGLELAELRGRLDEAEPGRASGTGPPPAARPSIAGWLRSTVGRLVPRRQRASAAPSRTTRTGS